jgi:DNA-binding NarL/FixJ family response regulator
MPIRILLADDHTLVRDGLRALLEGEPDFAVVASVATGRAAVQKAREVKPEVAVIDIAMPEMDGLAATEQLHLEFPEMRVVILSMHATHEHIHRAFRAGALGYLLKESAGAEVALAIRAVRAGRRYLTQRIADTVLDSYLLQPASAAQRSPLDELSVREREVLQLVVTGLSSAEIAARLHLSPRTVETYRARLMTKLGVHDLAELIHFALENGLPPLT